MEHKPPKQLKPCSAKQTNMGKLSSSEWQKMFLVICGPAELTQLPAGRTVHKGQDHQGQENMQCCQDMESFAYLQFLFFWTFYLGKMARMRSKLVKFLQCD